MTTTDAECYDLVKSEEPDANGATWGKGGDYAQECYAEFGATSIKAGFTLDGTEFQACLFGG